MMKKIFITLALLILSCPTLADQSISAYVDKLINKSFAILEDKSKPLDKKIAESEELIKQNLDLTWMSKFVLGKYRRTLSPQQVRDFAALYSVYVTKSYSSGVKNFNNQKIKVLTQQAIAGGDFAVKTKLMRPNKDPLSIDYMVRKTQDDNLKIFDIVTEGVSLINSHQAEFSNILASQNFESLLSELRTKIKTIDSK